LRIGVVSDIHGNAAALSRAIEVMGSVDELLCLGDSISEYRFSNETVALLRDRNVLTIVGNHEERFFGELGARTRTAPWIAPELMSWLAAQPPRRRILRAGRELLLVHSTPWPSDSAYVCAHHGEFSRFGDTSTDIVLYGHTHVPVVRRVKNTLVVNPGSAGEAQEVDGRTELSCAVLDVATLDAEIIRFSL